MFMDCMKLDCVKFSPSSCTKNLVVADDLTRRAEPLPQRARRQKQAKFGKWRKERLAMKGQAFSADFVLAVMIFLVLFAALMLAFGSIIDFSVADDMSRHLELLTANIADQLVTGSGHPSGWESNPAAASVIGLASSDRVLDPDKVSALAALDYDTAKRLLKTEGYGFFIRLAGAGITAGLPASGNLAAYARRFVMLSGNSETLELYLWRQT